MKVSIITPSYNQGEFIEETIKSVLSQTYRNIQYIIVDGGSSDNTMEIVKQYADKIDIVISEKDNGQSHAINKGFNLASGDLVSWVNSDDILYEDCVEKIVNLASANPDGVIYYSSKIDFIDKDGKKYKQVENKISNKEELLNGNYDVMQQGSFYQLETVKKSGLLNEDIQYCMDLDLWLRMLNEGKAYSYSDKALAAFRLWNGSKTVAKEIDFLNDIHSVLRKNGMSFLSANNRKIYISKFRKRVKSFLPHRHIDT